MISMLYEVQSTQNKTKTQFYLFIRKQQSPITVKTGIRLDKEIAYQWPKGIGNIREPWFAPRLSYRKLVGKVITEKYCLDSHRGWTYTFWFKYSKSPCLIIDFDPSGRTGSSFFVPKHVLFFLFRWLLLFFGDPVHTESDCMLCETRWVVTLVILTWWVVNAE